MPKIVQTQEQLVAQFQTQLRFIKKSCCEYDRGDMEEAKRIAVILRILLYSNHPNSESLISQLGLDKSTKFVDTRISYTPDSTDISYHGLISVTFGSDNYLPNLGMDSKNLSDYEQYWNKDIILVDKTGNEFTRKELVREVTDTDGGAHVDPELNNKYFAVSRENSLGWISQKKQEGWRQTNSAALASIRQIGHEILRTFDNKYNAQHKFDGILIDSVKIITKS